LAYRRALDVLAREVSAVLGVSYEKAVETIEARLGKRQGVILMRTVFARRRGKESIIGSPLLGRE